MLLDWMNTLFTSSFMFGDGIDSLVNTLTNFVKTVQKPAIVCAAIAICVGGYHIILGGDEGRQKAKKWIVGGAVGMLFVLGAMALANTVNDNVKFGQAILNTLPFLKL